MLPGCEIIENKIDTYPIVVTVTAEFMEDTNDTCESIPVLIWTGKQQDLFKKNPTNRTESIKEIKEKLREFVTELAEE